MENPHREEKMGRRKKEPEHVHREAIASAAEDLFVHKGIQAATMDGIAKKSGYSKATLYVYFANKEEIVGYLALKSMKLLCQSLSDSALGQGTIRDRYNSICTALWKYHEQYPLYFSFTLSEINVDFDHGDFLPVEKEIYQAGEQIIEIIASFIREGMETGDFLPDLPVPETVFLFWSALSGLVQVASNKQFYLEKAMQLSKQQFLDFGFDKLYRMIERNGVI